MMKSSSNFPHTIEVSLWVGGGGGGGGWLGGWGLGCVFAIMQKKVFILLVTHDHRVLKFFFSLHHMK